jgi:hypothetical protein
MMTAKKTANKTEAAVMIVRRLFLQRLRHAILISSLILNVQIMF